MKRAKMMLIAIAVLATVGGALAFKANKAFGFDYCIRTIDIPEGTQCPDELINYKFKQNETQNLVTYFYTTKVGEDCLQEECTVTTTFAPEQ